MPLLNSAVPAWRRVEVTPLAGGLYRVEGEAESGEEWASKQGELVSLDWHRFEDGEKKLVPNSTRSSAILGQAALRILAMLLAIAITLGAIAVLPRDAEGVTQPVPMAIVSLLLALASVAGMIFWRRASFTAKWMLRWGLGWGLLWIFYSLTP
jgi:hypothetical protein